MFQSFSETPTDPSVLAERFRRFLKELEASRLDGYVVSHADAHQSEYLSPDQERLAYLTGFTGSAGWALVLNGKGYLFVDGRYVEQAKEQANPVCFEMVDVMTTTPWAFLAQHAKADDTIAYHGFYLTVAESKRFEKACAKAGANWQSASIDPVEIVWNDDTQSPRPEPVKGQVFLWDETLAGETRAAKIARIQHAVKDAKADAALVTLSDSICWALNMRGTDIAHNPLALSFMLVRADQKPLLWIDGEKLSNEVRAELADVVDIAERVQFGPELERFAESGATILMDPSTTANSMQIALARGGAKIIETADPIIAMKARKNPVEQDGMRRAHLRDGAAMVKFLCWLDNQPGGSLTEIDAAKKLEEIRRKIAEADDSQLMEISFDTISAAGPHAALPHYRVNEHSNLTIEDNGLYLTDSGGQYLDGTTDITRVAVIGQVDGLRKTRFTQVLKGHIAIATARFPKGTSGAQLDPFARMALWQSGCDFAHGTGHGIGAFLCVHEGPARISKAGHVALEPGMILSNEPGYYLPGAFGVRLENLVIVTDAEEVDGGDMPVMGFETITFCPFDQRAIDINLLSNIELEWLNNYHHDVFDKLTHTDLLETDEVTWLSKATAPMMR